ncbi:hypothetical protein CPB83DRAFT_873806 [Crepidotus variabilis]|uniref:DUF7598 domain-containing protein n=1 Tax=Crepidotus variabilis TaxID=179855 RepID=A0A9P6JUE1_9AGAR|nr:hypothetical protein CPB83DRAFT_873806 [Crepidotus variabilis]
MIPARKLFFIGLNGVRALSLISLILVFSSTILVMVTNIKAVNAFAAHKGAEDNSTMVDCDYIEGSTVPNQPAGVFWAVVASLLIIVQTVALFLSECSWPMAFFDRFFPVLGSNFGLGALGIFQALISTQILSHHVDDFALVSAFFLFALGCINMLLGLIFRESAKSRRSIRAWREEAKGILPTSNDKRPVFVNSGPMVSNMFGGNQEKSPSLTYTGPQITVLRQDTTASAAHSWRTMDSTEKVGYGFGRQGEKAAGLRGFMIAKPEETLPRYASSPSHSRAPSVAGTESETYSPKPKTKQLLLARSATSASSTSSFYSRDAAPKEVPPPMPEYRHDFNSRYQVGEDEDDDRSVSETESGRGTPAPAFKSSRTVL